jgi:N-acetyl-gamma-glutamyl-phosphate reductase
VKQVFASVLKVGLIGSTGYSGEELIRILIRHPKVKLVCAMSRSIKAPTGVEKRFGDLRKQTDLKLIPIDEEKIIQECDLVFLALPHTQTMEWGKRLLAARKKVVDLAGDFRLKDPILFEKWYGKKHTAIDELAQAVYGLTEFNREAIRKSRLVANPGCYATGVVLAAGPMVKEGRLSDTELIADSKSGITGAGREPNARFHFPEMAGDMWAYKVNQHQHQPEMEQALSRLGKDDIQVTFTPQVIPTDRGILTTLYARVHPGWDSQMWTQAYRKFYAESPYVRVRDVGDWPRLKDVVGTNFTDIAISVNPARDRMIVISVLDNLVKGASGQAVQNMNVMYGWKETEGIS